MFPSTLYTLLWFGSYNLYKMVDYQQNLDGWLHLEATLFPTEPCLGSFDDLLSTGKANSGAAPATDLSDLQWFDENVDLSILADPNDISYQPNDDEILKGAEDLLKSFMDGSLDSSSYLPLEEWSKLEAMDLFQDLDDGLDVKPALPDVAQSLALGPHVSIEEAGSPCSSSFEVPSCSDPYDASSSDDGSPDASHPLVSVVALGSPSTSTSSSDIEEAADIDEVVENMRKRKFVPKGGRIQKVSLKDATFHPYARPGRKAKGNKVERKKVQNKEAAARYREKKRLEEKGRQGEVEQLEDEQKELRKQHDDLVTEIKYLKKLMCEMFQKKGILK